MKLTTVHVALLAVLMYGLSSAAYLLGEDVPTAKSSAPTVPNPLAPPAPAAPAVAPAAGMPPTPPTPGVRPMLAPSQPVIDRPAFASDNDQKSDDQLKILELKNADADTTAQQLRSLITDSLTIVPDERTNSIIIRGKPEVCNEAAALVLKLDQTETKNPVAALAGRRSRAALGPGSPSTAILAAPNGATMSAGNGTATIVSDATTISSGNGGGSGTGNPVVSDTGSGSSAAAMAPGFEIHTFHLNHANSNDVYNALMAAFKAVLSKSGAGAVWNLSGDRHVNDLIVTAPKEDFPQIDALITQLDSLNPPKLTIDVARAQADAYKLLSSADTVLQQAQSAQQLYNDMLQKVQNLPADQQQQFETVLKELQETQHRLADQTAAQEQLREDMVRRNLELRKRYEEQARRSAEDTQQLMQAQALQQRINALANDIRTLIAKADNNPSDQQKTEINAATKKLKDVLSHQFDDQQKGESHELQQLRQRLDKLEKEISDRAQNRNDLIQHRLDELLSAAQPISGQQQVMIFSKVPISINGSTGGGTLQSQGVTNVNDGQFLTGTVKLEPGNQAAATVNPTAATGQVFEVHVTGPKSPKVGEKIQLKLTATNRGTTIIPFLRIQSMNIDGLVLDANRTTQIGATIAPGESRELPLNLRVNNAGKIIFSATVQGDGRPATATYSAEAQTADSPAEPTGDN